MAEARTLYDKALSNYNSARILREFMGDDDEQLNIIAYHLQQALELSIKYTLELKKIDRAIKEMDAYFLSFTE